MSCISLNLHFIHSPINFLIFIIKIFAFHTFGLRYNPVGHFEKLSKTTYLQRLFPFNCTTLYLEVLWGHHLGGHYCPRHHLPALLSHGAAHGVGDLKAGLCKISYNLIFFPTSIFFLKSTFLPNTSVPFPFSPLDIFSQASIL